MKDYSRPMLDFVALKFGILIAKRLFNGKGMSSNLEFMPVANKVPVAPVLVATSIKQAPVLSKHFYVPPTDFTCK